MIGAGIGAASGGLLAALVEWGISEEEAEFYLEGIRRGGFLVAVRAPEEAADDIAAIMDDEGLIDLQERVELWRAEGWTGYEAEPYDIVEFDRVDGAFREHYDQHLVDTGLPYTNYTPAYRFGYHLTLHDSFLDAGWETVEPEARRLWAEEMDEPWEEYRDAVAYGWERSRR